MIGLDPDERSRELPIHEQREPLRNPVPPCDEASDDAWDEDDWEDWLFL